MTYTNEEIARAAGYGDPWTYKQFWKLRITGVDTSRPDCPHRGKPVNLAADYIGPDWPNDPGAVATHLLPVLEARWPSLNLGRECGWWLLSESFREFEDGNGFTAPTWHAAVIEAVMQTREVEA